MVHETNGVQKSMAADLWSAYWESRSVEARNALIMHFLPLVKFAAIKMSSRRGGQVEMDDLFQHGIFGMKDAIGKFDASRGVKFETYCMTRVRGAMLDGLKAQQWLPRELRQKLNRYNEARGEMLMEEGVVPEDERIAGRLGVCAEAIRGMESATASMYMVSLNGGAAEGESGMEGCHAEMVRDHREEEPPTVQQRADLRELFMRELTQAQRQVMMLYYYEEMTMREIGETLGISATRVSQMHSEIIHRLRERAGVFARAECKVV